MSNETNFFTKLAEVAAGGVDVTLRIKEKADRFTVQFLPEIANANKLKPLTVTGSPKELDEGFFDNAIQTIEAARGLKSNIDEVKQDAKDLATVKSEGKASEKKAAASASGPKSRAPKKKEPAAKKAVPKKKAVKKEKVDTHVGPIIPVIGDIFNQQAQEPTDQEVDEQLSKETSEAPETE